ncbi:MAG TPA: hypothetical protein VFR55_08770 [Dehalococcoidia bacterium]|nr:hypothetical protein [Dehalococcoidia bacterium]
MDADALIKLNHAGILVRVADQLECVIPEAVYTEAVTKGIAAGHADARNIKDIIDLYVEIRQPGTETARMSTIMPPLGAGETAVFDLSLAVTDALIVSDDIQFLNFLKISGRPAITPTVLIVTMVRQGFISPAHAAQSLAKMRPLISQIAYQRAMNELEN